MNLRPFKMDLRAILIEKESISKTRWISCKFEKIIKQSLATFSTDFIYTYVNNRILWIKITKIWCIFKEPRRFPIIRHYCDSFVLTHRYVKLRATPWDYPSLVNSSSGLECLRNLSLSIVSHMSHGNYAPRYYINIM